MVMNDSMYLLVAFILGIVAFCITQATSYFFGTSAHSSEREMPDGEAPTERKITSATHTDADNRRLELSQ